MINSKVGDGPMADGRTVIVVLGMHRSGTSLLSNALSLLGFDRPVDQLLPQPDNPTGFGEPRGVTRLNDRLLQALDATWDRPGPWYVAGEAPAAARAAIDAWLIARFADEAAAVLRASFPGEGDFVLKDPRLCLLMPFWREVLERIGATPRFVATARNPLAVAESLRLRNAMPLRRAMLLWQLHVLAGLRTDPAMPVIACDTLVDAPAPTMRALAAELGCAVPDDLDARLDALVARDLAHHRTAPEALATAPLVPAMVRTLWELLGDWATLAIDDRSLRIDRLKEQLDDALLIAGGGRLLPEVRSWLDARAAVPAPAPAAVPEPPAASPEADAGGGEAAGEKRFLILHYHLFKNAGSSVDEMLRQNFGAAWHEEEFAAPGGRSNAAVVEQFIRAHPDIAVLSSHTALMPLPSIAGCEIFPILFVRHPLLRLKSAYKFEHKQPADTYGAKLAKEQDFAGYISALLEVANNRQARDFQTYRFAFAVPEADGSEAERALAALDHLPFVGLVDRYDESLARLETLLRPHHPAFRAVVVHKNVTNAAPADPLAVQLARIRAELGDDLYDRAVAANASDIALFEAVSRLYDERLETSPDAAQTLAVS